MFHDEKPLIMGADASSMKDNAMNSEKITNSHTTEGKNSFNLMKAETDTMQNVTVEKKNDC
jgi:hypothetical protein